MDHYIEIRDPCSQNIEANILVENLAMFEMHPITSLTETLILKQYVKEKYRNCYNLLIELDN
jgi:hypothetical protein